MADIFERFADTVDGPARNAAAVTPNDSTDLTYTTRALYVGTAGDVKVDMKGTGTAVTFVGATGWMPIRVTKVYDTDTDAEDIVAIW